ncbi:probable chitinase 10 [Palaemon carinicauda]|uniref:probable chitinase 10 n=1 Tax=Palaemon carinicauda TaxID=392227 RepID=UPI0035B5DDBF
MMAPFWHLFGILVFLDLATSATIENFEDIKTSTVQLFNNQSVTKQHEDECSVFICPGDGLFRDPCDCRNYYNCYLKYAHLNTCPEGKLWSQQLKACDWKGYVECTVERSSLVKQSEDTDVQRAEGTTKCSNGREFVSVCYYSNWAYWRKGAGQYNVEDIDLDLCTHLVYAFAVLDANSLTIKAHDSWLDLPSGLDNYNKFTNLKNLKPGIKTTLAIGGWTDSQSSKYSTLVSSATNRQNFINHVIPFLKNYKFDGLDLDWEYPSSGDKANFGLFVKELKTAFEPEGLLLTAAVGASEALAMSSYDVPTLSQYLDYIHLMTYDFHGSWESNADHHSKLYNDAGNFDADSTVKKWIASGAPAGKLVLGVPLYGRSFTLSTSQKTPPAPAFGGGNAGAITGEVGYLGYLEICSYISNGWTVVKDSTGARGPYAYSGNQWVGYDDVDMVRIKAQYVKSGGLGGTMVWAIDLTDFDGVCSLGSYPLMKAMTSELQTSTNCGTTESPVTQGPVATEQPNTLQPSCSSQFVCNIDGLWADPCDCQKYYQCYPGGFNHYTCAEGTLWSQELLVCDWEQNVECVINPVATIEPTNGPVTENPITQEPQSTTDEGCANTEDFVIVCYYSNWAYYRKGAGQYNVEDIDLDLCTHLVYAFAVLDANSLTIKAHDSWLDLPSGLDNYNKFTNLKNLKPGIKTTLAIGGWTDSQSSKYSTLVSSATNRQNFINHVIPFLKNYKFDGLDLDWEYPSSGDKANFGLFVKELKTAFEPEGLLLTAAVGASEALAMSSYDVPTLSQYLDYIHLMTYDFHGSWESNADHHSKLYNDAGNLDADSTVKKWIASGASAGKLVLGVPLYGRSFTLSTSQKTPPAPASGGGNAGAITGEVGYLGYLEICTYVSNGWTVVKDSSGARGPYAYSGNQWVGYDDVDMVRTKAQYVKSEGLGGTMVWAIDLADFNGDCPLGRYPLLSTMKSELSTSAVCGTTESPVTEGPVITGQPQTAVSTTPSPVTLGPVVTEQPETVESTTGTTDGACSNAKEYVSVCYYSNWAYWREGAGQYNVEDIDLDLCTHLVYAFAVLDANSLTIKAHDSWLDLPSGLDNYNKFTNLKNIKPGIKTTLAIGGWTDSHSSSKYSTLVSSATNRQNFINHVIPFLKNYKFDGLDLDWEYPSSGDKANFGLFVKELKTAFEPEGLLLTAAVGASEALAMSSYDVPTLSQYLDYIHLMTYDFHGSWESNADHHSKLYNDAGNFDADSTVKKWIASGASAGKLVLGVPLYGRSFTLSTSQKTPPAPASGGGNAGAITGEVGYLGYLEICSYISNGWTVVKDSTGARGPYAYSGNQWVGYDDVDMVRIKAQYVKSGGLGGTMVWAIDLTDFDGVCSLGSYPLMKAMTSELQTSTNCGTTESPVTQGPVATEQPNTLQPSCSSQFVCTIDGLWADPCDCQKYYQCYPGGFNHYTCAEGTLWSQELLVCDWEQNVECVINPVATIEPTNGPVTENPITQEPQSTTDEGCANTEDFVIVCYYSNWAYYRKGAGQYNVEDIDLDLCTHLVYAFAVLDANSLTIKAHDSWLDLPSGLDNYNKFTNLKNIKPGIKTTLAIGGWTDSQSSKYSTLVSSATNRQNFINHVIPFLKNYKFDGLDLDWEYPSSGDKANFGLFVKELKTAFEPEGLLLTAAVGASEALAMSSYDVPTLSQYLDYIHLMTYDFHGSWESNADHHSKLYNDAGNLDADSTVKKWIASGASAGKLVLGVPLYGRSFTLSTSQKTPPAPASGGGNAGAITGEVGYLGYLEICTYVSNGWTVVKDSSGARGPYAYSGNQWVGYDDVDMVRTKAQYVKSEGLGGTMVWAIDLADFNGDCPLGRYPLLSTMKSELSTSAVCGTTESPVTEGPVITGQPQTAVSTTPSPVTLGPVVTEQPETVESTTGTTDGACSNAKEYVSVCYYSNWAYWREGVGQYTVDDIDLDLCTHLVYAFAVLDANSLTIKAHDTYLDLPSGLDNYNKFTNLKNLKPGIKTTLAIGGWTDSQSSKYSTLVSSATNRQNFINHVIPFLKNYKFDGLDLDWEYPSSGDKANFGLFVKELKTAFEPEGLLLTAAVGASEALAMSSYDVPTLSQYLDYIHLMTYDFHGSWESNADHHSKLYNDAGNFDADSTVKKWIASGASAGKLVLGVPLYGRSFTLSTSQKTPPAPASGGGNAGAITGEVGYLGYLEICTYISNGWTVVKDSTGARGPYAYSGNQWVGYDDVDMVRIKAQYVKSEGLGGTMVWAIDLTDFEGVCSLGSYPLLKAMRSELQTSTNCGTTESPVTQGPVTQGPLTQGPVTTEQPNTLQPSCNSQFACPGDGLWADPCDCQKYYQCYPGGVNHLSCAEGTLWNQEAQYCDWAYNVECNIGGPVVTEISTTVQPSPPIVTEGPTTKQPSLTTVPVCTNTFTCPGDGLWADPCDCQKYYQCYPGGVNHLSCAEGTLWNQEAKYCDWPNNVECNIGGPVVTVKPTTEQPSPTSEPECAYTFVCPGDGLWADPCDCQKYYQCSHGNGYQYACGEGTLWFQNIKNCNWASECTKPSLPVCEGNASYICSSSTDTVNMMCSDGSTATFKCPINLAWSSSAMNCVPFSDPTAGC